MSIRDVVSSVFRTALSAFCLLHPLQYPVHDPRDCHSSHPQLHLRPRGRRKAPALGLVSLSSRTSAQAPHVYAFATWCIKEVVSVVRCRQHLHCSRSSFRERDRDTPPFVLSCGERQEIIVVNRRPPWSPTGVIPLERKRRRGSDASSHHAPSTLAYGYLDLEQSTNSSSYASSKPLGARALTLVRLSLHYLEFLAYCNCTPRLLHSRTG